LSTAIHTVYVHARDGATALWGPAGSTTFNLDKLGPISSAIVLTPSSTNGLVDVTLQATASDAATGGHDVDQAEFFIDATGVPGTGTALTASTPTTVVSLNATILAATVAGLAEGSHTISVRAHDIFGNWGPFATASLVVDKTGPNASLLSTNPNPTNGLWGVQGGSTSVFEQRLDATITDPTAGGVSSNVVAAEYFVDTIFTAGTGHLMVPLSGTFTTGTTAAVYQLLNLYAINALTQGQHLIYVHGKDAAGNWGPYASVALIIDKTGPNITGASVSPNPTAGATTVTLSATATDPANTGTPANAPASNVIAAEWFVGADPGAGLGTPITVSAPAPSVSLSATINVSTWAPGDYTLSIRAQDAAHNWGPAASVTLTVTGPAAAVVPPAPPAPIGGGVAPIGRPERLPERRPRPAR
jgi:hypothetical protein